MKLLISAYACAPQHGSEHAVGWNWITEAHRRGHTVWALVSPNHRNFDHTSLCREHGPHWYQLGFSEGSWLAPQTGGRTKMGAYI